MSLSKAPGKHTVSKSSGVVHVTGAVKAKTAGAHLNGAGADISYHTKLGNPAAKVKAFTEANLIVLTVNPELDKAAPAENAKAESAKRMFADYRDKK